MRNEIAEERITTPIQAELLKAAEIAPDYLAQMLWTCMTGDNSQIQQALGQMSQPLLNQLAEQSTFISSRASTEERLRAEKIMSKLNLSSHDALVSQLIAEKANELGVA